MAILQTFPRKCSSLPRHVRVIASSFRNGYGPRIHKKKLVLCSKGMANRNVRMPVQQNIAGHQFRRVLFVKDVSVRQEEQMTIDFHQGIIRQNREIQHHLVYFRFAVAADTENAVCHGIQHRNHGFRIVALRKIIPWAMIENVAK